MEKQNRKRLRELMEQYDVKGPAVAQLLGRSLSTIHVYLSKAGADIQDETLIYLEHKLKEQANG